MFIQYGKKGQPRKPIKDLTPFSKPAFILGEEKRSELLKLIDQTMILETERATSLCQPIPHNLINYCQLLPESAHSYYIEAGGIIDHALNRTEAALNLFRQFVLVDLNAQWSQEQKLWQYALYSAAFLQEIGKLYLEYEVKIYDHDGDPLGVWNPLLTSMVKYGEYYSFEFKKEGEISFRRRLNLLLARQIMPTQGFDWIATNPKVLAVWLALLNEDYQDAGTLGSILIRAEAIAIRRYFKRILTGGVHHRPIRDRISTFAGGVPESIDQKENKVGVTFIDWLVKSLETGQILINKPPLFIVPGGLLLGPDIFKLFIRQHTEFKNWMAVQTGFSSLGLHQVGPNGEINFNFNTSKGLQNGMLVSNYALLLADNVKVEVPNDEERTFSAIELIHRSAVPHLSASGEWLIPTGQPNSVLDLKSTR